MIACSEMASLEAMCSSLELQGGQCTQISRTKQFQKKGKGRMSHRKKNLMTTAFINIFLMSGLTSDVMSSQYTEHNL